MLAMLTTATFVGTLVVAAASDLRTRRIPNVLTMGAFLVALMLRSTGGLDLLLAGLLAAGIALVLVLPLIALGAFGGGDAKLLIAAAVFLGPERLLDALLYTALAGGALALAEAVRRRVLLAILINCRALVVYGLTLGRSGSRPALSSPGAVTIPYGVAIAVGCVAAWFA